LGWKKSAAHLGRFNGPNGELERKLPPGAKPVGIIAIANVIKDMRAMTSLSLASNGLGVEEVKIIAAVLPKCT
jgi:hypothetical protein